MFYRLGEVTYCVMVNTFVLNLRKSWWGGELPHAMGAALDSGKEKKKKKSCVATHYWCIQTFHGWLVDAEGIEHLNSVFAPMLRARNFRKPLTNAVCIFFC